MTFIETLVCVFILSGAIVAAGETIAAAIRDGKK